MSTQSFSISTCLSCIAANRLVLSLRGLYHTQDPGNTAIAAPVVKPDYDLRTSSRFRARSSTFTVVSSRLEAVDAAVEEENDNRLEQSV